MVGLFLIFGLVVAVVGFGGLVYERKWGALVGVVISTALGYAFWRYLLTTASGR